MNQVYGLLKLVGQYYGSFLASSVIFAGLLVWVLVCYGRACKPRRGTLEWISLHDKPFFSLTGEADCFGGKDILLAAAAAFGALLLLLLYQSLQAISQGAGLFPGFTLRDILYRTVDCLLGGAGIALLCRSAFRVRTPALLAGLLFGFLANASFCAEGVAVWSLLLLWRWVRQENDKPFWKTVFWLLGAVVLLGVHLMYSNVSLWLLPLFVLAFAAKLFSRVRTAAAGKKTTPVWVSVLVAFGLCAPAIVGLWLAASLRDGQASVSILGRLVTSKETYQELLRFLPRLPSYLVRPVRLGSFLPVLLKFPLVVGGLLCLGCTVYGFMKRRNTACLAVALTGLLLLAQWVFTGSNFLTLALLPAVAYVWSVLWKRRCYVPVFVYAGGTLAFHYINWLLVYSR